MRKCLLVALVVLLVCPLAGAWAASSAKPDALVSDGFTVHFDTVLRTASETKIKLHLAFDDVDTAKAIVISHFAHTPFAGKSNFVLRLLNEDGISYIPEQLYVFRVLLDDPKKQANGGYRSDLEIMIGTFEGQQDVLCLSLYPVTAEDWMNPPPASLPEMQITLR